MLRKTSYFDQTCNEFKIWRKFFVGRRSCRRKRCVREINVSRAGDPVHAGDKALTQDVMQSYAGMVCGFLATNIFSVCSDK
jgi:hypothetical protein